MELTTNHPHLLAAQRCVLEQAQKLIELNHCLYEITESLTLPSIYLAMEEESVPYNSVAMLFSSLHAVRSKHLREAIQILLKVTQHTDEQLLLRFNNLDRGAET